MTYQHPAKANSSSSTPLFRFPPAEEVSFATAAASDDSDVPAFTSTSYTDQPIDFAPFSFEPAESSTTTTDATNAPFSESMTPFSFDDPPSTASESVNFSSPSSESATMFPSSSAPPSTSLDPTMNSASILTMPALDSTPSLTTDFTTTPSHPSDSPFSLSLPSSSFEISQSLSSSFAPLVNTLSSSPSSPFTFDLTSDSSSSESSSLSFDFVGGTNDIFPSSSSSGSSRPTRSSRRRRKMRLSEPVAEVATTTNSIPTYVPDIEEVMEQDRARRDELERHRISVERRFRPQSFEEFRGNLISGFCRNSLFSLRSEGKPQRSDVVKLMREKNVEVLRLFRRSAVARSFIVRRMKAHSRLDYQERGILDVEDKMPFGVRLSPFVIPRIYCSFAYSSVDSLTNRLFYFSSSLRLRTASSAISTFHQTSLVSVDCSPPMMKDDDDDDSVEALQPFTPNLDEVDFRLLCANHEFVSSSEEPYVDYCIAIIDDPVACANNTAPFVEFSLVSDNPIIPLLDMISSTSRHYLCCRTRHGESVSVELIKGTARTSKLYRTHLLRTALAGQIPIGNHLTFLPNLLLVVNERKTVFSFGALLCFMGVLLKHPERVSARMCLWGNELEDAETSFVKFSQGHSLVKEFGNAMRLDFFEVGDDYTCMIMYFERPEMWAETWFYRDKPMMQQVLLNLGEMRLAEIKSREKMKKYMASYCNGSCLGFSMNSIGHESPTQMLIVCGYPFNQNRGSFGYHIVTMLRVLSDDGSENDQSTFSQVLRNLVQTEYVGLRFEDAELEWRTEDCHRFIQFLLHLLSDDVFNLPLHVFEEHILSYLTELDAFASFHVDLIKKCEEMNRIFEINVPIDGLTGALNLEDAIQQFLSRVEEVEEEEEETALADRLCRVLFHSMYSILQHCSNLVLDNEEEGGNARQLCSDWNLREDPRLLHVLMDLVSAVQSIPKTASWRQVLPKSAFIELLIYIKNLLLKFLGVVVVEEEEESSVVLKEELLRCLVRFVVEVGLLDGEERGDEEADQGEEESAVKGEVKAKRLMSDVKDVVSERDLEWFCNLLAVECPRRVSHLVELCSFMIEARLLPEG